jgi:signal transduction histidine kinase
MHSPEQHSSRGHLAEPEEAPTELDRRVFHLKTLYDVSRELLGVDNVDKVLKNFLLMTLGNFGVADGFIVLQQSGPPKTTRFQSAGLAEPLAPGELDRLWEYFPGSGPEQAMAAVEIPPVAPGYGPPVRCAAFFEIGAGDRGVLGLSAKITEEDFSADDRELLQTMVNNLVVALRNAQSAEALKRAYEELLKLSKAKDRAIEHLSHELKTPLAVLKSSLKLLSSQLREASADGWQRAMARAERGLARLFEMQDEVDDILQGAASGHRVVLSALLDECADILETLAAEQGGSEPLLERIRRRIEELFHTDAKPPEEIRLDRFVGERLEHLGPLFSHRNIRTAVQAEPVEPIRIPPEILRKLVDGLVRNAVENTPDEGCLEIAVSRRDAGVELAVRDGGVGILAGLQERIFEGFHPTQETHAYSSRQPFDFDAGGRGADLLRMRLFAERYGFRLEMSSTRCPHLPKPSDRCPGRISACGHCRGAAECDGTGGSTFRVFFPL